jgi:hypothetical protein
MSDIMSDIMSEMGLIEALGRVMRGETLPAPAAPSSACATPRPARPRPARLERPDRQRDLSRDLSRDLAAACAADPERQPWPEDWFRVSDPMDAARCLALWQAALAELLAAALMTRQWELTGFQGPKPIPDNCGGHVPWDWIGTRGFHEVCDLAGFDGAQVAASILSQARSPVAIDRLLCDLGRRTFVANRRRRVRA